MDASRPLQLVLQPLQRQTEDGRLPGGGCALKNVIAGGFSLQLGGPYRHFTELVVLGENSIPSDSAKSLVHLYT